MRVLTSFAAALLLLPLGAACAAKHEGGAGTAPATPAAFATAFVNAVRAGDSVALKRLVHPKALACLSGANAEVLTAALTNDLRRGSDLARDYKVTVTPEEHHAVTLPESLFAYPVEPAQRVQIDVDRGNSSSLTILRELAPSDGGWLMTYPCPTPAGLRVYRATRGEGQR